LFHFCYPKISALKRGREKIATAKYLKILRKSLGKRKMKLNIVKRRDPNIILRISKGILKAIGKMKPLKAHLGHEG
jgi:hypothetical protein